MGKLLLLLVLLPVVEIFVLISLGQHIGWLPTIGLLIGAGLLGSALARFEGLRVMTEWQRALAEGRMPDEGIVSGGLVLLGGLLLILPGLVSDVLGLLLIVPFTRRLVARVVRRGFERRIRDGRLKVQGTHISYGDPDPRRPAKDQVIDVPKQLDDRR